MKTRFKTMICGMCCLLICPLFVHGDVFINEFMASNGTTYEDTDDPGDYPDWIEIFNNDFMPLNLTGWYITDDLTNPKKYQIKPGVSSIGMYGLGVLFADGETNQGPNHLGFKLSAAGEAIGISQDGVSFDDYIIFGEQQQDISYGRFSDGQSSWYIMDNPSPSNANNSGYSGIADEVMVVPESMTFTVATNVTLSTLSTGAVIRYTLDGNLPTNTSTIYTNPIPVTQNTWLRARAFETEKLDGPIASHSYFHLDASATNFNSNLPLMIVDNFGEGEMLPPTFKVIQEAHMLMFEPGLDGLTRLTDEPRISTRIGIRRRGHMSDGFQQKGYLVEARDEFGDDKDISPFGMPSESDWILGSSFGSDRPFVRNTFTYEISSQMGHYAPRYTFVEMFLVTNAASTNINYSDHYLGCYRFVEKIKRDPNRVDVERLRPDDNSLPEVAGGYIFKVDKTGNNFGANGKSYQYSYPDIPDITTNQSDYLKNVIAQFDVALEGPDFKDPTNGYLPHIDLTSFVDYNIMSMLSMNLDGLRFSTYFHKYRDSKLLGGPVWDFDLAYNWSTNSMHPEEWHPRAADVSHSFNQLFWRRLFQDENYFQAHIDRWCELREDVLADTNLIGVVRRQGNGIIDAHDRTVLKFPGSAPRNAVDDYQLNGTYEEQVLGFGELADMYDWLTNRANWVDAQWLGRPALSQDGGAVTSGYQLVLTPPPTGTNYYTLDGSDPRGSTGQISVAAIAYTAPIPINGNTVIKTRAYDGGWTNSTRMTNNCVRPTHLPWSGIREEVFVVSTSDLAITEIMYNPRDPASSGAETNYSAGDFEFIEIKNIGSISASLLGVELSDGVEFDFTHGALTNLPAGDYAVVVANLEAFKVRYTGWAGINILGEYSGSLDNNSENINLSYVALANDILSFDYEDDWYTQTDGEGYSLHIIDDQGDPAGWGSSTNWRSSSYMYGSPGSNDPAVVYAPGTIVINEALTHQDVEDPGDWIELYNASTQAVNIQDWYLSDNEDDLTRYRITNSIVLNPGGFAVFTENTHFGTNAQGTNAFALSEHGDRICLSYGSGGALAEPAYREHVDFGAADNGVTLGRYVKSDGYSDFTALESSTYATNNSAPKIGPVVISEIMYNPTNGWAEYVEIVNISESTVELFNTSFPTKTWEVTGIDFDFPTNTTIGPNEVIVLIRDTVTIPQFQTLHSGMPGGTQIYRYPGNLDNGGERLELRKRGNPDLDGTPNIVVDMVNYKDTAPWPLAADGAGPALSRISTEAYGNDAVNWTVTATGGEPGIAADTPLVTWLKIHYPSAGDYAAVALSDSDDDGMKAEDEFTAGTDPTNSSSVLRMLPLDSSGGLLDIRWWSVTTRSYKVFKSTNLVEGWMTPPLTNILLGGPSGTNSITDDVSTNSAAYYLIKAIMP